MKKFVISVFLAAVFCGSAFCSEEYNFGNKPEEKELLANLEYVLKTYWHDEEDVDGPDLGEWAEDVIYLYKEKHNVDAKTDELLCMLIGGIEDLYSQLAKLFNAGKGDEADQKVENWSIYQLLEEVKKQ